MSSVCLIKMKNRGIVFYFLGVVLLNYVLCKNSDNVWSPCSRSCNTGLSNRIVPCLKSDQSCRRGDHYQYKLCNTQPCLKDQVDFKQQQCQLLNKKPFHGVTHNWVPFLDPKQPCVLMCRTNDTDNWQIQKVSEHVLDGTRCEDGPDAVCIGNKCLTVGCDGVVESGVIQDQCGVCGGDGTDCLDDNSHLAKTDSYKWQIIWSHCSVSCGTGLQQTNINCLGSPSGDVVTDDYCPSETRPHTMTKECFKEECTVNLIPACEGGACPEWITDEWSQCSVTCGKGHQYRVVTCQNNECPLATKPTNQRICYTGTVCAEKEEKNEDENVEIIDEKIKFAKPRYTVENWSLCSVTCGNGIKTRVTQCKMFLPKTQQVELLKDSECMEEEKPVHHMECQEKECPDIDAAPVEASYSWRLGQHSPCSKTCLAGEQYPSLECINEVQQVVDDEYCSDLPKLMIKARVCNDQTCPPRWEVGDYGPCTAECGGGVQERPVECIEQKSEIQKVPVESHRCTAAIPISKRNCNTQFCPARWMTRAWSDCSASCGVGLQTRRAFCVKSPIANRQVTVSDTECMGPKPLTSRECHQGKCFGTDEPPPVIKSENYTFVQFRRSKQLKLIVGGRIVLIPGQSAVVKCPVKHFQRKLIFWSKGYKLLPMMAGRTHTTFSGNLKLRKTNPETDAGTYTCSAGFQSATVTIEFQTKKEAFKKSKKMQKMLQEANKNANLVLPPNDEAAAGRGVVQNPRYNATKQLIFTTGDWSTCSQTCGSGQQTREVKCTRITRKYMKMLNNRECIKWGLAEPKAIQKCLIREDCPTWEIGQWSKCIKRHCVRDGYAQKKRPIHCVHSNGTKATLDTCGSLPRPEHKMECRSYNCYSVWKTTKWTECLPRCAKKGFKSRTLTCVWKKTKRPAWSACKGKSRPVVKKTCTPRLCIEECEDRSRYCNLVGMLKMCRYSNFRFNCCNTCQGYLQRNS